jgi:CDP-glucose 4,6-dehydratase
MTRSDLMPFESALVRKRIVVTGHTGFTGSWCCLWLTSIGAEVYGCALAPDSSPSLFEEVQLEKRMASEIIDIRQYDRLARFVSMVRPEMVLHLAAQPLVRRGFREPRLTFETNALGTMHVLEAARHVDSVTAVVCVTTDKVYRNDGSGRAYREDDPLGASDPYGASKAAAEMVVASYSSAFGKKADGPGIAIATARGGNIIGGGDWAEDRLVPDYVRAIVSNSRLELRNPEAIRPWQHVLALVQGYLMLLAGLLRTPDVFARPWNFGPLDDPSFSVRDVLDLLAEQWTKPDIDFVASPIPEARTLALDSSLARTRIGWIPPWDTKRAIAETAAWYREFYRERSCARALSLNQIEAWRSELRSVNA